MVKRQAVRSIDVIGYRDTATDIWSVGAAIPRPRYLLTGAAKACRLSNLSLVSRKDGILADQTENTNRVGARTQGLDAQAGRVPLW